MKLTMLSLATAALLAGSSAIALAQTSNMGTNSPPSTAPTAPSPGAASGNTMSSMSNSTHGSMHGRMAMSSDQVKQIQSALDQKGEHVTVDGKWGKQTAQAVRKFQKDNGLRATGHADHRTMQKLGVSG